MMVDSGSDDRGPSGPVADAAPEPVPAPTGTASRELRLALVCYGGVSLAIYMHGVTKELERLVAASCAYQDDQEDHPFAANDTAAVYWQVLKDLEGTPSADGNSVRTRVVIDIVSGTSAGGINGVFLATAIARNRTQDALRGMWMDNGDIKRLLIGREGRAIWLKVPRLLRAVRRGRAVLDGGRIARWLREALATMGSDGTPIIGSAPTLLGDDERLQLFVPVTDFNGYDVQIPADDPAWVLDRTHQHVLRFVHDPRPGQPEQLSARWDDALAFAARATSSFPGAFPPLSIADYRASVPDPRLDDELLGQLFAPYRLAAADVEDTFFIDGGVLDNKPFGTTLAALRQRPAAQEVDRRLIYVEPDPSTEAGPRPDGRPPGLLATAIAGYAGIPRQEPIIGDLRDLDLHNSTVGRIRDVIETNFGPLREIVVGTVGDGAASAVDAGDVGAWRRELAERVAADAGLGYPTYLRLRVRGVVDDFAARIARRHGYPPTSSHAIFVRRVLAAEADREHLFERDDAAATAAQLELIDALDVGHLERHVRFLIAAVNWWYRPAPEDVSRVPDRTQLDETKHALYEILEQLAALDRSLADDATLSQLSTRCFGPDVLTADARGSATEFVEAHADDLAALRDAAVAALGEGRRAAARALDAVVAERTAGWSEWARTELLTRHLGFAAWDAILYPIRAVSDVDERDQVEVMRFSPHESQLLATSEEKSLKGATLGHFGAFFSAEGRQNDYLWGRLDAAERLLALLRTPPGASVGWHRRPGSDPDTDARLRRWVGDVEEASRAIGDAEREALDLVEDRLAFVTRRAGDIDELGRPRSGA